MSYKCQKTIEQIFQKELILKKQIHQNSVKFKDIGLKYEPYLCNGCHGLMQKDVSFNNIASYSKDSAYKIHFWYISKNDAISIINSSNQGNKMSVLYIIYKI